MSNDTNSSATRDLLFVSDEWLTADELDRQLVAFGSRHSAFDLERQRHIFSVERDGFHYFAAYQFNAKFEPMPIMKEVLARLGTADCWAIAAWFYFPNGWISPSLPGATPVSPKEALGRTDEVLLAAEKYMNSYVA